MEGTPTNEELYLAHTEFIKVKSLIREDHLFRYILKCNRCGQFYLFEFYETIDWEKGNDPQYKTYVPVKTVEEAEKLSKKSLFELNKVTPRLQSDFLQDGTRRIAWVR